MSWAKSSYSKANGNCLEWRWRKSTHSNPNGECVEARQRGTVQVRDSQDADGPVLSLSLAAWRVFLGTLR